MASRYSKKVFPQTIRLIRPAATDIWVTFKQYDNIDNLAQKYYGDATLGWIIMCANPDYFIEFLVPCSSVSFDMAA